MSITPEQLDEWEKLCNEATPGPWVAGMWIPLMGLGDAHHDDEHGVYSAKTKDDVAGNYDWEDGGIIHRQDQVFIAAARTAVPDLIARVRELEAQLSNRAQLDELSKPVPVSRYIKPLVDDHLKTCAYCRGNAGSD